MAAGNNWCSPYKGWQAVYENDPLDILQRHGVAQAQSQVHRSRFILSFLNSFAGQVVGGEVALWTEQTDSGALVARLEPRTAAAGERWWAGSRAGGWREAEPRMVRHRARLGTSF